MEFACVKAEEMFGASGSRDGRAAVAKQTGMMMSWLKSWWKPAAVLIATACWLAGLADQFDSFEMTARYVVISAAMVAVAMA
jgi:hypothetical protein